MYRLTLENENGNQITFNELGGAYEIEKVEGLDPTAATINTSEIALIDGQQFNSAKVQMRTLQIAFAIEHDAAANRLAAFRVCRPKHKITVYYVSDVRDVYINGYVQDVAVDYYAMKQVCTVTILCPAPYWRAAQSVVDELSNVTSLFRFPFSSLEVEPGEQNTTPSEDELVLGEIGSIVNVEIVNAGEVETGLIIELRAFGPVANPKIYDYVTGDFIGVNFNMIEGDLITINTNAGEKSVTLLRNGVTSNIFNSLMQGVTWLQLPFGGSTYTHEVASGRPGDLNVTISHNDMFEGV